MVGQAVVDIAIDVHVGVNDNLVQTLQVVVLQDFLEAEDRVRLRAAPFSRVDRAFFKCWQDVAAAHCNRRNADVAVSWTRPCLEARGNAACGSQPWTRSALGTNPGPQGQLAAA